MFLYLVTRMRNETKKKNIELTNKRLNRKYIIYLSKATGGWCYSRLNGGTIIIILIIILIYYL